MLPETVYFDEIQATTKDEGYNYAREGHLLQSFCKDLMHIANVFIKLFPKKSLKYLGERELRTRHLAEQIMWKMQFADTKQQEALKLIHRDVLALNQFYAGMLECAGVPEIPVAESQ
jgi:hypothetical protein